MSLEDAAKKILKSIEISRGGEIIAIQSMNSFKILDLAETLIKYYKKNFKNKSKLKFIGIKKSEKLYEELLTTEEAKNAVETKDFIIVNEKFDLKINQKMYKGRKLYNNRILNSKTVKLLNQNQILNYLLKKSFYKKLDQMKNILGIQWGDTATVSAIKNGRVISAIAEERFTRKRYVFSNQINKFLQKKPK